MAIKTVDELKTYFETGDKPTQQQFWDWLDSYLHKGDGVEIGDVTNLTEVLQEKANASDVHGRVYNEIPAGVIDGVNDDFVLDDAPIAGKHSLYLNGVKQKAGTYLITGNNLHTNAAPLAGDELSIDYDFNI